MDNPLITTALFRGPSLSIPCGGYYIGTPAWNRKRETNRVGNSIDFMLPVDGRADINTGEGKSRVQPGYLYFIPGRGMIRGTSEIEMAFYWSVTITESTYFGYRLGAIREVHSWPVAMMPSIEEEFRRFVEYFEKKEIDHAHDRTDEDSRLRKNYSTGLGIKIQSTITYLIGDLIEAAAGDLKRENIAGPERIKPAIDFMDKHYLRNPQLQEIASQSKMAPHYFHRLFKRETGITPFKYMEGRRLDLARELLFDRSLNIKEVATRSGYHSATYFWRAFYRRFGHSPSAMRASS